MQIHRRLELYVRTAAIYLLAVLFHVSQVCRSIIHYPIQALTTILLLLNQFYR